MSADRPTRPVSSRRRLLPGLDRHNAARELMAGITLIAISVPLNIGYAQIAGLPASAGLYALIVPSVVFALVGSSRQLVVAPDAAAAAMVASSLAGLSVGDAAGYAAMAASQAILGGAFFLLCGWLKLGFLANFLSKPILAGFVGGLALDIMLSQVAKMLGLSLGHGEFVENAVSLITHLGETHLWTLALSFACLLVLTVGRRLAKTVPWALIVMVAATAASSALALRDRGVAVLGEVPSGLPTLAFPSLSFEGWLVIAPSALALTAVTVAEGLMVTRSYSEMRKYPNHPNRDLVGLGLANLSAGLTSSFTVGSSTSRTAAMDDAGSRTQLPALVLALGSMILLLFGTSLLAEIPAPAIGATVAVAVVRLLGLAELRELWHKSRDEFVIAVTCFAGVLLIGPISGLFLAFFLALINLTRRAASPQVTVLADPQDPQAALQDLGVSSGETSPGVVVLRLAGPVFFANASALTEQFGQIIGSAPHRVRHVVLDVGGVSDIDTTGADALEALHGELRGAGVSLCLARANPRLRKRLAQLGTFGGVPRYATNREALTNIPMAEEV